MSGSLSVKRADADEVDELFEAELELIDENAEEILFGEYLVEEGALSRGELLEALREHAHQPGVRLHEVIAYLGYLPYTDLDLHLTRWRPRSPIVNTDHWIGKRLRSIQQREYQIVSRLARGGMAEVWKGRVASGPSAERGVAIKTIRPGLAKNPRAIELFAREAQVALSVRHPGIVHVFDFGLDDGVSFLVMEHLRGATLRELLERLGAQGVRAPLWWVAAVTARVCDAVQRLHDLGGDTRQAILHNDLSPENVMVTFAGAVKVIDLGSCASSHVPVHQQSHIRKYSSLPPELIFGRPLDRRSDVYSLGVMLYELATGAKPFASDPRTGVPAIVRGQALDPREHDPSLPDAFVRLLRKAIAVEPAARQLEARVLAAELRALQPSLVPGDADLAAFVRSFFPERARAE